MRFRCLVAALALLIAFASDSWGESKRVSPPREEPKTSQQPAATDQRGTEQSPAIIKVIPTPKTPAEAEVDRREREVKNKADWALIKLTGILAIVGVLQLLVFGWQGIQLKRTVDLGNKVFIAEQRPQLHVRHISVQIPLAADPEKITGTLIVVNRGGTEARIVESRYRIYSDSVGLPMLPPLNDHKSVALHGPNDGPIVAGGSIIFPIESTELLPSSYIHNIQQRGIKLYVMGYVRYVDLNEDHRFMGFCRIYDPPQVTGGNSRFVAVANADYEYED